MTTAALARSILGEWLVTQSVDSAPVGAMSTEPGGVAPLRRDAPVTKVTLRMPAERAAKLARAARAAELSQGMYVVQLLDSLSDGPLVAGPRETLAALSRKPGSIQCGCICASGLKAVAFAVSA